MKSILDPSFKYTSSANTNIAKTFARIRRLQRASAGLAAVQMAERPKNVSPFRRPVTSDGRVA